MTPLCCWQLFDFDLEVKPVLEVLIGKTIEQSLMEVMEEEELSNLREQQRQFQQLRNAELVEQQRLEEQDRRRRAEKVGAINVETLLSFLTPHALVQGFGTREPYVALFPVRM